MLVKVAVTELEFRKAEAVFSRAREEGCECVPVPAGEAELAAALGPEVGPFLLPVEERRLGLRIHGVIASPEFSLSTARSLYVFGVTGSRPASRRARNFAVSACQLNDP